MNGNFSVTAAACAGAVLAGLATSPWAEAQSRGELLYSTHCISCHTSDIHWRDQRAATDWSSLRALVRRWQGAANLGWNESDIDAVAHYLNESVYHYPRSSTPLT